MRVFSDNKSVFIKHGERKIRPIAPSNQPWVKKTESVFKAGDTVTKKHHGGSQYVTVSNADHNETWYIQYLKTE